MAGVAGRSGGHNRKLTALDETAVNSRKPTDPGYPQPDWYLYDSSKEFTRKQIYQHLAKILVEQGLCDKHDGLLVSMIAQQYYTLQHAMQAYDLEGPGALIGRALASRLITEAQKEIRILLAEFYLTPSTRHKKPGKEKVKDDLSDFLSFVH